MKAFQMFYARVLHHPCPTSICKGLTIFLDFYEFDTAIRLAGSRSIIELSENTAKGTHV